MSPPADIIRQLLINLGHVTAAGTWPIFVSFLKDVPDDAVCVYDTAGKLGGRIMSDGEQIEFPGIQIRVRGLHYPVAYQKAKDIALALDAQIRTDIAIPGSESYIIHNVSRQGSIVVLGMDPEDDRRRYHFTINALVTISQQ